MPMHTSALKHQLADVLAVTHFLIERHERRIGSDTVLVAVEDQRGRHLGTDLVQWGDRSPFGANHLVTVSFG